MRAGRIEEQGPTMSTLLRPRSEYTRRLIAAVPTLEKALAGVTAADLNREPAP
jgi:peptide/nickel transport system ATP-binding protein